MLKIRNPSLQLLANLTDYTTATVHEKINAEYTLTFDTVIDDDKSQYIANGNIVDVAGNYFAIVHHRRRRTQAGELLIQVDCEQVNQWELNKPDYNVDYFTGDGTPAAVLAQILAGTGFTVGTVEYNDPVTYSLQEPATRRAVLMEFAGMMGGELLFDKYQVSLLQQRGANRGVQFRVGKNVMGVEKDVDDRSGETKTAYAIDVVELNSLDEFRGIEYFELGDTVRIIDPDIGVNEYQRIVEYDYDPRLRMNSKVVIANHLDGIEDSVIRVQRSAVAKGKVYNGIKISPDDGFEAVRSDNMARTVMNATDGIRIQKGDGSGSNWTDQIYMDAGGNAKFLGKITTDQLEAGSIKIGSALIDTIKANQIDVSTGKITTAQIDSLVVGSNVTMGPNAFIAWDNVTSKPNNIINPSYIQSTYIDATSIQSPTITGGTLTGATIQTAASGSRMTMTSAGIKSYNSFNEQEGITITNGNFSYLEFYYQGSYRGSLYQAGGTISLESAIGSILLAPSSGSKIYMHGIADFTGYTPVGLTTAAISGLEARLSYLEDHAFILAYKSGSTLFFNSKNVPGVDSVAL